MASLAALSGGARCGEYIVGIPSHSLEVLLVHTPTETLRLVQHGVPGGYKWGGGVADGHAPSSCVWAVPSDASSVLRIVPSEGVLSVLGGLAPSRNKWQGGVLGRDGHVYCIPCDAPQVGVGAGVGRCGRAAWRGLQRPG